MSDPNLIHRLRQMAAEIARCPAYASLASVSVDMDAAADELERLSRTRRLDGSPQEPGSYVLLDGEECRCVWVDGAPDVSGAYWLDATWLDARGWFSDARAERRHTFACTVVYNLTYKGLAVRVGAYALPLCSLSVHRHAPIPKPLEAEP